MIHFFSEDVSFKVTNPIKTKRWLKGVVLEQGYLLNEINYIFCSDDYLLEINRQHLDHDYFTDIITFDNSEDEESVEADIFISIDRVGENAKELGRPFDEEMRRVLVHGVLHLTGLDDSTDSLKREMRNKEDFYLSNF